MPAERKRRNKEVKCPLYIKIGICIWIFVVIDIILLIGYLHFTPWHSAQSVDRNIPSSSTASSLRSFYLSINKNNNYLNPENVNNEIVVYQLLTRILITNSINKSDDIMINSIVSKFKFFIKPSRALCKSSDIIYGCYKIVQNKLSLHDDAINIYGSNIPSIISGLSYYLSTYWMVSLSWNGNNIYCLLSPQCFNQLLSKTPSEISIYASRRYQYTYYKNPCTDSYSMVWWDWNRWQQELDWMVMNNINLLLLPTMNELIEYELYTNQYSMTDDELSTYFVGPAFLAWFRMGNLRGWPPFNRQTMNGDKYRAVGVSKNWLKQQLILTYKIMARCIELGIDMILPGFSGHVPTSFVGKVKNVNFYDGSRWFGMPNELTNLKFLDATDEFYVEIGLKYQKIQYDMISSFLNIKHNAKDINDNQEHTIFLWLDQFNELTPKSSELSYLQKSGENQLKSLQLKEYYDTSFKGKVKIKWTIQGWMFVHMRRFWDNPKIEAYFKGIKSDDILILDLIAEKGSTAGASHDFFKHDHVWCFLHNFGGGHGLSGNLENIFQTLSNLKSTQNMKGIGISMEGIHNNPILYHAVLYHSYHVDQASDNKDSDNQMIYLKQYICSRYGMIIYNFNDNEILQIWQKLVNVLYKSAKGKWSVTRSLIVKKPSKGLVSDKPEFVYKYGKFKVMQDISKKTATGFQTTAIDYPVCDLLRITHELIQFVQIILKSEQDKKIVLISDTFANDVAEIMRQSLSDIFQQIYLLWKNESKDDEIKKEFEKYMLDIIDDTDEILSDFKYFRLDEWIKNARKFGVDQQEKDYFELNARNLVTRWGPNGEINDYSSREWNGLMKDYYKQRWKILFDGGNINKFENDWQYLNDKWVVSADNSYLQTGNYDTFYKKILKIFKKYSDLVNCVGA